MNNQQAHEPEPQAIIKASSEKKKKTNSMQKGVEVLTASAAGTVEEHCYIRSTN